MSQPSHALIPFDESIYSEVHRLARARLRSSPSHSLSATVLVHEAWLRLHPHMIAGGMRSRSEFLALAAKALRSVVVDHARQRKAAKRNPGTPTVVTVEEIAQQGFSHVDVLTFHDVLNQLCEMHPRMHQVVEMRVFGGCDVKDIARTLEASERTVKSDWRAARAWLETRLSPET